MESTKRLSLTIIVLLVSGLAVTFHIHQGRTQFSETIVPDMLSAIQDIRGHQHSTWQMAKTASSLRMPDYWPTTGWRSTTPEEQGMNSTMLNEMMEHVENQSLAIDSAVVVRHGYVVLDEYPNAFYDRNTTHQLYSVTKSFSSALIGIAIEEGFIDNVEHKLVGFFPNRTIANLDSRKQTITLEHLLTMTSGLPWDEWTYPYGDYRNDVTRFFANMTPVQFVLDRPMAYEPGAEWVYNSGGSHLLSAIINETTGNNTMAFAREHLFNPLGIWNVGWEADYQGLTLGFMGLHLRPLDMAKFGYLYLNNGTWDGQQVVPAEWVARSTESLATGWGDWGYGYQWWIHPAARIYEARGYQGQYIIVVPDYDMVVVFTASMPQGPDPENLLYDFILPAVMDPDHDISVTGVTPSKTVVGSGYPMSINATVRNRGMFTETFRVTAYANFTLIISTNVTLAKGNWTTFAFTWDTSGFPRGKYTLIAYAWPVLGEINMVDNVYVGAMVHVGIPGDVDPVDGYVGIDDIFAIASHFGQQPGDPQWGSIYDLTDDDYVGIDDIFIAASYIGQEESPQNVCQFPFSATCPSY